MIFIMIYALLIQQKMALIWLYLQEKNTYMMKIKTYIFVKLDAKLENLIQKQVGQNAIVQFKKKIQKQILMI